MLSSNDIDANKPVIVKWAKPLTSSGVVTEGVMAGQATEFLTRLEEQAELLSQFRFIETDGETQDIQSLRVRAHLQNMNKISGANAGAQIESLSEINETVPEILKDTLVAVPFTAYTYIPKTFLRTNIEKEGFISKYESLLVPSCAFSAEQISIFGKATNADAMGYHALSGILDQLDSVKTYYDAHSAQNPKLPMGEYTTIDATDENGIIPQIDAMLEQYTFQKGKRKMANIYVSSKLEAKIIAEMSKRETELGDRLLWSDSGNCMVRGREVIQLDALDNPVNNYGDVIIIMNPDSIGYMPVFDIESESAYVIERKSYLTSVDIMFDVGIIFAEDVLYADVNYSPSNSNEG